MPSGFIKLIFPKDYCYLTESPEITYFKTVYRRHTNFMIESYHNYFITDVDLGEESVASISKRGDLWYRNYLEIRLPQLDLIEPISTDLNNLTDELNLAKQFYLLSNSYLTQNMNLAKKFYQLVQIENLTIDEIISSIHSKLEENHDDTIKQNLVLFINQTDLSLLGINTEKRYHLIQEMNQIDIIQLLHYYYYYIPGDFKSWLEKFLRDDYYRLVQPYYLFSYQKYIEKKLELEKLSNQNGFIRRNRAAWVENIGNTMIEWIEVSLGDQMGERLTGEWLNVYGNLYISDGLKPAYHQLIGQVDSLTSLNDNIKKSRKLFIPLPFWFSKRSSLALPLIQLHDIEIVIKMKLKNIEQVLVLDSNIDIDLQNLYNLHIPEAQILSEYIFLDSDERKRFINSTNQYIIETVKTLEYHGNESEIKIILDISDCVKLITWSVKPIIKRYQKPSLTNNPVQYSNLNLNGKNLNDKYTPASYYDTLMPYSYFDKSGDNYTNIYSFAINPFEMGSSGFLDLSQNELKLEMKLKSDFMESLEHYQYTLFVHIVSYAILSIKDSV